MNETNLVWYIRRRETGVVVESEPLAPGQMIDKVRFAQNCPGFIEWLDDKPTEEQIQALKVRFKG